MPRKGCLGCSFPVFIILFIILLALSAGSLVVGALGYSLFGNIGLPAWLSVPRPSPELPAEVVFHLFGFPIANSVIAAWLTIIVLIGTSYAVTRRLKLIPSGLQSLVEFVLEALYNFCKQVAGEKHGRQFFPVVTTIFLFVIFNAWLSLLPGFGSISVTNAEGQHVHLLRGANTDINVPLAIALMSFIFVEFFGLKAHGFRYLSKFFNFGGFFKSIGQIFTGRARDGLAGLLPGVIQIFVGILELLSELIRILSFTFRLFGNMTAGEILLLIVVFLAPWVFALPFYGMELLVGFVQALIFSGLTLVFLTLAVASHDGETTHQE